jgi:MFS family permease
MSGPAERRSHPAVRPPLSPFAALRHRNFRLFYTGQTVSLLGTWMGGLAQGWLVLELTNSAFWVGLVGFLGSAPILLFTLPAGVYVDRTDKRRLVTACQGALLALAAALAALSASGRVQAWHVAAVATLVGLVNSVEIPARQSFIVELVGKDDLTNAIALNSSAFNATRIVGPAIAGLLVARFGVTVCFAINAASYAGVLAGLLAMRLSPQAVAATQAHALERFREGMRFVRGDRRVLALVATTAVLSLFGFPYLVLMPVFARDVLAVGAEGLGVMSASVGVGALASALGLATLGSRASRGRLVAAASRSFGLAVAAFAVAPWLPLALLLLGVAGFAMVLNNAVTNTLLQSLTPDRLRGRVMSLWAWTFVGIAPLGSLLIGALAERIGAPAAVAVGGLVSAAAAGWMWSRAAPEVRELR